MGRRRTQKGTKEAKKVNKRLVRQTLKGCTRADKSIQQARRVWLAQLTTERGIK
ncbi:MAG: hypothetical protein KGJ80_04515 [Chloroflexota bacterium]|nr:hypothetical protein [Chloroflexota bacterium]